MDEKEMLKTQIEELRRDMQLIARIARLDIELHGSHNERNGRMKMIEEIAKVNARQNNNIPF